MSDRLHQITVALEDDMYAEDVEPLLTAIRQMRGVVSVTASRVEDGWAVEERVLSEMRDKVQSFMRETFYRPGA